MGQRFNFNLSKLKEIYPDLNFRQGFIVGVSAIHSPQDFTMLYIRGRSWKSEYNANLSSLKNSLILIDHTVQLNHEIEENNTIIKSDNARLDFAKILKLILDKTKIDREYTSSGNFVTIGENVKIGKNVVIEPFVFIDHDVTIGDGSALKTGCRIRQYVTIGKNVIIGENSVIGAQGFGIETDEEGKTIRIPHLGGVVIKDNVEVGALTSVVGGTIEPTIIESNAMIDDLNHIAHNCQIGQGTLITGCAEVSGSVEIGEKSYIAPNSTLRSGISLGRNCFIGQGANVIGDVPDGTTVFGNPAKARD